MPNQPFLYNSPEEKDAADNSVERATQSLKQDYTLVGKSHIKPWQAWFIIGLIAGTTRVR